MSTPTPPSSVQLFVNNLAGLIGDFSCKDPVRDDCLKAIDSALAAADFPTNLKSSIQPIYLSTIKPWFSDSKNQTNGLLAIFPSTATGAKSIILDACDQISKQLISATSLKADGIWSYAIERSLEEVIFWCAGSGTPRWTQMTSFALYNVLNLVPYLSAATQASPNIAKLTSTNWYNTDSTGFGELIGAILIQFTSDQSTVGTRKQKKAA
jgi:hypothetical protein